MGFAVLLCALLAALHFMWTPGVLGQSIPERNGLCGQESCFVVYFQRKTFLEAWRHCKEKGGNLATMKRSDEAQQVEELLAGAQRRGNRAKVRVWIGLQRQPRQCSATRPLRGFSWTTGDQDTQYTNWLREDSPSTCSAPRCVVTTYSTYLHEQRDNYKWLDGSCSLPVDGFVCKFVYEQGMCQPIPRENAEKAVLYSTPFYLLSSRLTNIPFGSMATVPCPEGTKEDQSVLCLAKEDGTVGWHMDGPYCTHSRCKEDNGGCQQLCFDKDDGGYYCECHEEFRLAEDEHSCLPVDPCKDALCEHECVPSATSEGYYCTCRDGYQLAPNGLSCLDKDECQEGLCEQACENSLGSFVCHCYVGFHTSPEDPRRCQDFDECQLQGTCEHMCVNYIGGFQCHCLEGYELQDDYSSCRSVLDINTPPTTTVPVPWVTTHPESSWFPQIPDFSDLSPQQPEGDRLSGTVPQDWRTASPQLPDPTDEPEDLQWEQDEIEHPEEHSWHDKLEEEARQEEYDRLREQGRKEERYREEEQDREEEQRRQVEPDRQEELYDAEKQDREEEQYYEEEQDREEEQYTQEEQDRLDEQYRQEEQNGQGPFREEEQDRQEERHTQEEQDRPAEQDGLKGQGRWDGEQVPTTQQERESHAEYEEPIWPNYDITESWASPDWTDQDWQALATSPSPTSPPDWYEDESTTILTAPVTPTPGEDAWHWPPGDYEEGDDEQGETPAPWPEEDIMFWTGEAAPSWYPTTSPQVDDGVVFEAGDEIVIDSDFVTSEPGSEDSPERESSKQQGNKWLLIALLVPLCIFVVVMVALGIVYCTRCAGRGRSNKTNKDSYHWISGADKTGAPSAAKV